MNKHPSSRYTNGMLPRLRSITRRWIVAPIAWCLLHTVAATAASWESTHTGAFFPRMTTDNVAASPQSTAPVNQAVHVVVALNLRNESGSPNSLDALLQAQRDPHSNRYNKPLTASELAQYQPTQEQVDAVVAHLGSYGFTHIVASPNRLLVSADGTTTAAAQAFNTAFQTGTFTDPYTKLRRHGFANTSAAQVPDTLHGLVRSVMGLENVTRAHVQLHRYHPAAVSGAATTSGGQRVSHSPVDMATLYQSSASVPDASQTVVGTVASGDLTVTLQDLSTFAARNSMPSPVTQVVNIGSTASSDTSETLEWNLDSQVILATSGGTLKQLVFYNAASMSLADVTAAYNAAQSANVAKIVNVSLGSCESDAQSTGTQAADDAIFKLAAAQGQTFVVSAGDNGVYECGNGRAGTTPTQYSASEPATSPWVMAIGGTSLLTASGQPLQRVDETAWNDGVDSSGVLTATGGGVSQFEPAPPWQVTALGNGVSRRQLPDLAFDADPQSGVSIVDSAEAGGSVQVGGTSLAAPIFVGIWARMQSATGNLLGFPAPNFYAHAPAVAGLVHDVVSGNNGTGTAPGYSAAPGYDNVTGWGSLNMQVLHALITGQCASPASSAGQRVVTARARGQ